MAIQKKCNCLWTEFHERNTSLTIESPVRGKVIRFPSVSPHSYAKPTSNFIKKQKRFENRRFSEASKKYPNYEFGENNGTGIQCDIESESEEDYITNSPMRPPMSINYKIKLPRLFD